MHASQPPRRMRYSIESRLRVVMMRAIYLDEQERRAGPATQAWPRSGARAAGDPSPLGDTQAVHPRRGVVGPGAVAHRDGDSEQGVAVGSCWR